MHSHKDVSALDFGTLGDSKFLLGIFDEEFKACDINEEGITSAKSKNTSCIVPGRGILCVTFLVSESVNKVQSFWDEVDIQSHNWFHMSVCWFCV